MKPLATPLCVYCKHLDPDRFVCSAFPDGIPDDIIFSLEDHRFPIDGDGGIMFERSESAPEMPFDPVEFVAEIMAEEDESSDD